MVLNRMPSLQESRIFRPFFFAMIFVLAVIPGVLAQEYKGSEDLGREASPSEAQATMASLFGRGATIPSVPHMNGTIALPSFDSSEMKIDEESLRKTES